MNNKGARLRSESAGRKEVQQGPWEEQATGSRERWFDGALQLHHLICTAFLAGPLVVRVLVIVGCHGPFLPLVFNQSRTRATICWRRVGAGDLLTAPPPQQAAVREGGRTATVALPPGSGFTPP